jgi:hypothetical protein
MKVPPCFEDPETKKIIRQICNEHGIDMELLKDLCELMNEYSGSGRRFGLPDEIDSIINRFFVRTEGA